MTVRTRTCTALGTLAIAVAMSVAQSGGQTGGSWGDLRRVEPGRSDVSPLAVESRVEPLELRQSIGFESLFRGQGQDGRSWFARRDAGLTAVFDRSVYVPTAAGDYPLIPPGTTFVIGEPASILASKLGIGTLGAGTVATGRRDASGGLYISTRESTLVGDGAGFGRASSAGARAARQAGLPVRRGVGGLLRMAATNEKRGG